MPFSELPRYNAVKKNACTELDDTMELIHIEGYEGVYRPFKSTLCKHLSILVIPLIPFCIKKGGVNVGHVPRELTANLVKFIDHGGAISSMQGARESTTRKRIRSSVFLFISRKEETINCNAKVYLSSLHISIDSIE